MSTIRNSASSQEDRRLATLRALDLLDSQPEQELDALVALAADLFGCPIAQLTVIDADRQCVMASHGAPPAAIPRDIAFCAHTIRADTPLVVPDTWYDPRFAANPLVTGEFGVRFYAAAPVLMHADDGEQHAIGALCVIDAVPRSVDEAGMASLTRLALLAGALLGARRTTRSAIALAADSARQQRLLQQAQRMAMIGSWRVRLADNALEWSENVFRIHELPVGSTMSIEQALDFYPPRARAEMSAALARTIETGAPFDLEAELHTARGSLRRVRALGELERHGDLAVAVVGVFQDVTERHAVEQSLRRSAETDPLTGIANRAAFDQALDRAIGRARAYDTPLVLALIDLDSFKAINDTLGHVAGDDVLREVGRRLGAPWLAHSIAARIGGDEFALIIDDAALAADLDLLIARLQSELCVPLSASGMTITAAGAVGTARWSAAMAEPRDLVEAADTALYAAKRARVGNGARTSRAA